MIPSVESLLRKPLCALRHIAPAALAPVQPALSALRDEVDRLAVSLHIPDTPAGMEMLISLIDVASNAPPVARDAGASTLLPGKIALMRLQYRLLHGLESAEQWILTLRARCTSTATFRDWLDIAPAWRYHQVGPTCTANVLQFCVLRSQAYSPSQILAALRQPSSVIFIDSAQSAYKLANTTTDAVPAFDKAAAARHTAAKLGAAIPYNLLCLGELARQEGEQPARLEDEHFQVALTRYLRVELTVGGFCSMSDVVPVPPGQVQPSWRAGDRKGSRRLQRERLSSAERSWLQALEGDLRGEGIFSDYLLVALESSAAEGHLVVVDMHSLQPGIFDPNLGFLALPEGEWISDHLLWLICLLAIFYEADVLWFGSVSFSGPRPLTHWHAAPRRPRLRLVRRPPRKR